MTQNRILILLLFAISRSSLWVATSEDRIDDREVTLRAPRDIDTRRQQLIAYLWGSASFPGTRLPDEVITHIPSPVQHLDSVARVDELRCKLAPGLEGLAYHFLPQSPNGELVVLHHGHACTFDDDPAPEEVGYGLQRTIQALLRSGYGVLGVFMPHMRPGDCTGGHEKLFEIPTEGSPLKFFLEPVAISLNYLKSLSRAPGSPEYRTFHMLGLSGGGWTTTVYAAIDPTIQCSISVAGTIPLYLRSGGSIGDREQFETSFYRLAGYPDLYVLGSHGRHRRQLQIVIRRDDCCFGEAQHDAQATGQSYDRAMHQFERTTQQALSRLGPGSFQVAIDEVAPSHMISHHALAALILPELARGRAK